MNIPTDYKDIIEMLLVATNEGRVRWLAKKFRMEVSISECTFTLCENASGQDKRGFVAFTLLDKDEHLLDTWSTDEGEEDYDRMKNLYAGAKRQALKLPQRLASIREEIHKSAIIGEPFPH